MQAKFKTLLHFIALFVFIIGSVWSIHQILQTDVRFKLQYLLPIIFLAAPLSLYLSISRFKVLAKLYGGEFTFTESANIVVLGGLANLLPIPGALLVRLAAIRAKVGSKKSLLANIVGICLWLVACLIIFALAFFLEVDSTWGEVFLLLSTLILIIIFLMVYYSKGSSKHFLELCFIQIPLTFVNTLRLWFLCLSVDYLVGLILPASISLASIVVSGASITPGGIGVAELMSSTIALQLDYPASIGFIMLAGNRLITWLWFAVVLIGIRRIDNSTLKQGV